MPDYGQYELVLMYVFINGRKVRVMVDDGATHYKLVEKLKLP